MGQSQSQSQRAESYDTVSISHDLARQLEWNAKSEDEKIGISPPLKLFQQHPTVDLKVLKSGQDAVEVYNQGYLTAQKEIREELYRESVRREEYLMDQERRGIEELARKLEKINSEYAIDHVRQNPWSNVDGKCNLYRSNLANCMNQYGSDELKCHLETNEYLNCALTQIKS